MDLGSFSKADTTRVYYYSTSKGNAFSGKEQKATNKAELEEAIKKGKVYCFRVEINNFYFNNQEQAS